MSPGSKSGMSPLVMGEIGVTKPGIELGASREGGSACPGLSPSRVYSGVLRIPLRCLSLSVGRCWMPHADGPFFAGFTFLPEC
jgi:hypothetical protein